MKAEFLRIAEKLYLQDVHQGTQETSHGVNSEINTELYNTNKQ